MISERKHMKANHAQKGMNERRLQVHSFVHNGPVRKLAGRMNGAQSGPVRPFRASRIHMHWKQSALLSSLFLGQNQKANEESFNMGPSERKHKQIMIA